MQVQMFRYLVVSITIIIVCKLIAVQLKKYIVVMLSQKKTFLALKCDLGKTLIYILISKNGKRRLHWL